MFISTHLNQAIARWNQKSDLQKNVIITLIAIGAIGASLLAFFFSSQHYFPNWQLFVAGATVGSVFPLSIACYLIFRKTTTTNIRFEHPLVGKNVP